MRSFFKRWWHRLNMDDMNPEVLALARAQFLVVMVLILFGLSATRASWVMLIGDERLDSKASFQFFKTALLRGNRGNIYSRDVSLLATSVQMPVLHLNPQKLAELERKRAERQQSLRGLPQDELPLPQLLLNKLPKLIDISEEELTKRMGWTDRQDVTLSKRVSPITKDELIYLDRMLTPSDKPAAERARQRVLWVEEKPVRYYPGRHLAAQTLGVSSWDGAGAEGIELQMDSYLRGAMQRTVYRRDRMGRALNPEVGAISQTTDGYSILLTLDRYIQKVTEDALDELMKRSKPKTASAVVVDVHTGEVLAMSSRPTTNLNRLTSNDHLQNYAISYTYEPGSVIKPLVVGLALDNNIIKPSDEIYCERGRYRIPGTKTIIQDANHAYTWLSIEEILKFSSNIGMSKIALGRKRGRNDKVMLPGISAHKLVAGLQAFGFSTRTGIELPNEASGVLRTPLSMQLRSVEKATTSYGQGMTATTLQLAVATAALGNSGVRMRPYLVAEVRDQQGIPRRRTHPRKEEQAISAESARIVLDMMESVFKRGGTGVKGRVPGFRAAGKTGTAEKVVDGVYSTTEYVATFVGLVPLEDPQIAIAILADTPGEDRSYYGGVVAGPTFSQIAEQSLLYLGYEPDDYFEPLPSREGVSKDSEEPRELLWVDGAWRLPDFTGASMREAVAMLSSVGVQVRMEGSGHVIRQNPEEGAPLYPGTLVELVLN